MFVFVNGKEQPIADGSTVQMLLDALGMSQKRVAVEVNTDLVTKSEWERRILQNGDKVEVVSFVGGG